jgi:putative heme-binding domain-containing protein
MRWAGLFLLAAMAWGAQGQEVPDAARGAAGLDSALATLKAPTRDAKPLSAAESLKLFRPRPGYAVDLIASEPAVRQPLHLAFDARGRMWVTQYVQYPFPAGLRVVAYDKYIRAKFDKTPPPPPRGERGADRITIHEDADGDGSFEVVKTFVDGLSIATATLPVTGGAWVMNPPYLLFYPDEDGDDVPDADPVVHLSGFGLEDTHAVANSLAWGPDGWIYGAQGSTCTAKVRVEVPTEQRGTVDFLGQAIWRYHPERHLFELFAEGGGNTFGVEFDDGGRVFSGTNWGKYRGLHYVQGGYYVKGWGKHGPLTNPYAFGFFEHMPHAGDAARLVHTFAVYGGGLMPGLTGKAVGANSLQSRVQVTRIEPDGRSSFRTVEEAPLLTSDDGWFRPVELKVGPDGAVYVCDFYEGRISHVDPRDTWDRSNGRIWRVRPEGWRPARVADPSNASADELVRRLADPSRQVRWTGLRALADRGRGGEGATRGLVAGGLRDVLTSRRAGRPLEALWAIHLLGGLDGPTARAALAHADADVRRWAVRLLGDRREAPPSPVADRLVAMAKAEADPQVRSQLASTAKRLPGDAGLAVAREMLLRDADAKDSHLPLLLWWAIEAKLRDDRAAVVGLFADAAAWRSALGRAVVAPRVARALASTEGADAQRALVTLLRGAPGDAERTALLAGVNEAFDGRAIPPLLPELAALLAKSGDESLAARAGDRAALGRAIALLADDDARTKERRIKAIELLGQVGPAEAAPALLKAATTSQWHSVRRAALGALTRFNDPSIGRAVVAAYAELPRDQGVRPAAVSMLLARPAWSLELLKGVEAGAVPRQDVTADQLDRLGQANDRAVAALLQKVYGQLTKPTSDEKAKEVARVKAVVQAPGERDAAAGKAVFAARCAACHVLFREGRQVGPDLTPYERRNLDFLLVSTVDPSAAIREEFVNVRIDTADDQTFVGLVAERGPDSVTLIDSAQQRTVVPKRDIKDERAMTLSVMPERLLDGLTDRELRDLFAYLQK